MLDLAVLCGAGYLTLASLSKAAMLSFALLLLLALVCQGLTRPTRWLSWAWFWEAWRSL